MPPKRNKGEKEGENASRRVGKTKEELYDLLLRYGCNKIRYPDARPEWLESHVEVFSQVQKLGKTVYDDYQKSLDKHDPFHKRVRTISTKARLCCGMLEDQWRTHETFVFQSFDDILICPNCFGRAPRCEEHVAQDDYSIQDKILEDWREIERCRCSREPWFYPLFNGIKSAGIPVSKEIEKELVKKKPDLVYGLREAGGFNKLLKSLMPRELEDPKGQTLKHSINLSSFSEPDMSYLPFLVLEAKRDGAVDDWHAILVQTGLPLKACLDIQRSFFRLNEDQSLPRRDPLVWFLMNRGEIWKVCAAYLEPGAGSSNDDSFSFEIAELWNGLVTDHNGALQLILIVDYISEWATEYRNDIIKELALIREKKERLSRYDLRSGTPAAHISMATTVFEPDFDRQLDSDLSALNSTYRELGSVRHVNSARFRFCILFITPQNVVPMISFLPYKNSFANAIMDLVGEKKLVLMGVKELREIEESWTGLPTRWQSDFEGSKFLTLLTFSTYLAEDWTQVLEISGFAIHPNAEWELKSHANKGLRYVSFEADPSRKPVTKREISKIRQMSPQQRLSAAISHLSIRLEMRDYADPNQDVPLQSMAFDQDNGLIRSIVYAVYKQANGKPDKDFLWLREVDNLPLKSDTTETLAFHFIQLRLSRNNAVLLYDTPSGNYGHQDRKPKVCLYLLEHPKDTKIAKDNLATIIKEIFSSKNTYRCIQCDGIAGLRSLNPKDAAKNITARIWNVGHEFLEGSTHERHITEWILRLDPNCNLLDKEIIAETPTVENPVEEPMETPAASTDDPLKTQETLHSGAAGEAIDDSPPTYHTSEEVEAQETPFKAVGSSVGEEYVAPTTRSQNSPALSAEETPSFRRALGTAATIAKKKGADRFEKTFEKAKETKVGILAIRSFTRKHSDASAS